MDADKAKFMKIYADLPLGLRRDIVAVLDSEGPISWNAAYFEVEADTEKGKEVLRKLKEMEII